MYFNCTIKIGIFHQYATSSISFNETRIMWKIQFYSKEIIHFLENDSKNGFKNGTIYV